MVPIPSLVFAGINILLVVGGLVRSSISIFVWIILGSIELFFYFVGVVVLIVGWALTAGQYWRYIGGLIEE